jgi:N-acylneuraminate cytidylyltransferase/CMP-N,N'-diacetyllegionaminic acid synthase
MTAKMGTTDSTVLCTICARGGSKGVPGKNLREVGGLPLMAHTIEDARDWGRATDIVVSTDDEEIIDAAREYGASAPFERPAKLATDDAPKLPVVQHALRTMEEQWDRHYDYIVDLDPTSPLRLVDDIEMCFRTITEEDATNVYSVCEARKNPYFNMVELDQDGYATLCKPTDGTIGRRQDAPPVYEMNASIYVYERDFLLGTDTVHGDRTKVGVMPPERSVDIDNELDLAFVEFLMDRRMEP